MSSDEGTLGDIGPSLNLDFEIGLQVESVSFAWYTDITLRKYGVIGDFYKRLSEERGKEVVYGYLFGWLAGTDLIYTGPAVSIHTGPSGVTWFASARMGPLLLIDPRDPDAALGYGPMFGVGVGSESFSIAVRTIFSAAGQHYDLAEPDPTYYNAFLTVNFHGRSKNNNK